MNKEDIIQLTEALKAVVEVENKQDPKDWTENSNQEAPQTSGVNNQSFL